MWAQLLLGLDLFRWQTWTVPIVGLGSTGLALIMGGALLRWRRRRMPPPSKKTLPPADPFVHGSVTEKRSSLRRTGNPIKVLISNPNAPAEQMEGWVMDRSVGGLCLSVDWEAAEDDILNVRTANASNHVPWVQVQVKRCQKLGEGWELGCEFVRTPSWSVLLLFG
jgi:hypothetical protein